VLILKVAELLLSLLGKLKVRLKEEAKLCISRMDFKIWAFSGFHSIKTYQEKDSTKLSLFQMVIAIAFYVGTAKNLIKMLTALLPVIEVYLSIVEEYKFLHIDNR